MLWERWSGIDQKISTICCGWVNRGLAMGEEMLFLGQLDTNVVALNIKTGKEVWKTPIEDWHNGYVVTSAPLYYDGIVYSGIAGGEFGVRGRLTALDAKTGKILWRWHTLPGPGRGRQRHLAGRHRSCDARRGNDMEYAGSRSRSRPRLFRHRQLRARLRWLDTRRRQPVLCLDRGPKG
jgi:outer membrane protein assembly factor BamB